MKENVRDDFNRLLEYCMSTAEMLLKKQGGEFYPFGAYIDNEGSVVASAIYDGDEFPLSDTLIEGLKKVFEERLRLREIGAYSITYDTRVTNDKFPEKIDAIATRMEHQDSNDIFTFFFRYKIATAEVRFFESFGEIQSR